MVQLTLTMLQHVSGIFSNSVSFTHLYDKHKVKIGVPDCPVTAAEQGKQIPVQQDEFLTVTTLQNSP